MKIVVSGLVWIRQKLMAFVSQVYLLSYEFFRKKEICDLSILVHDRLDRKTPVLTSLLLPLGMNSYQQVRIPPLFIVPLLI